MASAAVEGFVTGFAGTLAQNVIENKQRARDYFDKQVEFARTTGLENRNRVRETVNSNISIARQLEAVGVPKEVIMAQVNQDPAGLSSFYEQAEKIRASTGKDFTSEEWKAIFKVAGDFKAPDEDIATFISRTYDPIANAASEPDFTDDPEGTLISRMMGFNAMDQARSRLGETVIADGMTADQLIRYGDVQPQRVGGNAVVTTNYSAIPNSGSDLSSTDTDRVRKWIDETAVNILDKNKVIDNTSPNLATARQELIDEVSAIDPSLSPSDIERLVDVYLRSRGLVPTAAAEEPVGEPEGAVEAPVEPPVGDTSPEPTVPSEAPPTASTAVEELGPESVVGAIDEVLKNPDLANEQRRALELQRTAITSMSSLGYNTADMLADAAAYLNLLGVNLIEYGIGVPLSTVYPEGGAKVFEYTDKAREDTQRLAGAFQDSQTIPPPQGAPKTVEVTEGEVLTLVRDNRDGTATYVNQNNKEHTIDLVRLKQFTTQ
jgi:hypothetical protein